MRRLLDIACAAVGLAVLSPLFALIAAALKLEDGGPVFYSQARLGRDFRPFRLYKFRSMVRGAERLGPRLTLPRDPRITRVGALLRSYKLDELPQLLNLLKGDMQLVGARPELEPYVRMFRPQYAVLLRDRPGITDPASLVYRREHQMLDAEDVDARYVNEILPHKLDLSLEYASRRTLLSDLGIIFRTVLGIPATPRHSPLHPAVPTAQPQSPARNVSTKIPS